MLVVRAVEHFLGRVVDNPVILTGSVLLALVEGKPMAQFEKLFVVQPVESLLYQAGA